MHWPYSGKVASESDQVCEPTASCATITVLLEFVGVEEDPTDAATTEGELLLKFTGYSEELDMEFLLNLMSPMVLSTSLSPTSSSSSLLVLPSIKPVSLPCTKFPSSLLPLSLRLPTPLQDSASLSDPPPQMVTFSHRAFFL